MIVNILNKEYLYSDKFYLDFKNDSVGLLEDEQTEFQVEILDLEPFYFYLGDK